jgi:hypothetical protein
LPPALSAWQLRQTSPQVVTRIDELLNDHTAGEIAARLNAHGYMTGAGRTFHRLLIERLCRAYRLTSRYDRLRARGLLTLHEMARLLDVHPSTVKAWTQHGLLRAQPYNDKAQCLYEHPGERLPMKMQGRKLTNPDRPHKIPSNRTNEVQCEA